MQVKKYGAYLKLTSNAMTFDMLANKTNGPRAGRGESRARKIDVTQEKSTVFAPCHWLILAGMLFG